MSSNNLSNELFFQVHRGLVARNSSKLAQKTNVGMHWSADKAVAKEFAEDYVEPGFSKPFILHGDVPVSSVETNTHVLESQKVGGDFSKEKEVPVKPGSPVYITGRTSFRLDKSGNYNPRKRTYNPPREATA